MRWSWRKALGLADRRALTPLAPPEPPVPAGMRVRPEALQAARASSRQGIVTPWVIPEPTPGTGAPTVMAMDWAPQSGPLYSWAQDGMYAEGLGFYGFAYLAELMQRSEYRQIVLKYAEHATRKWIELRGGDDTRRGKLDEALKRLKVRETFRTVVEHDGAFGRGQIYIDMGAMGRDEQTRVLIRAGAKLKGRLKGFKTVEPVWSYPGRYNSTDPLSPEWYRPTEWYVSGKTVHDSRLLTVVGAPLPDMLKPAYAFAGLSRTQMAKPYVDNWLRTRQSVSDITHAFSVMVLSTDMAAVFAGTSGAGNSFADRMQLFTAYRDNLGVFALNKDTEEFTNVSAPLSSLDKLQAQAQEQMASVAAIPLVELLGITPSGLNASSDGEVRTFYANVKSYQERALREPVAAVIELVQLSEFGDVDPDITFEFLDLWELGEVDKATVQKTRADTDAVYVNIGAVSNEEVRERLADDETSIYHGVDLSGEPPELDDGEDDKPAQDSLPFLATDSEHWITINGGNGDGQHVLIESDGGGGYTIKGGAGGALNGKHVTPKSMSGARAGPSGKSGDAHKASAHADAHPRTARYGTSEAHRVAEKAHMDAAQAHADAWKEATEKGDTKAAAEHSALARAHRNDAMTHRMEGDKLAKKERATTLKSSAGAAAVKTIESRYAKGSHAEIAADLDEKYGLKLRAEGRGYRIRSHTDYNIDDNTPQSKAARKTIGMIAHTLDRLEERGIDVKATLSQGSVTFAPGNVGKAWGHAFQAASGGVLTLSSSKANVKYLSEIKDIADRDAARGKQRWTVANSHPIEEMGEIVTIHELAHAVGMQASVNSPAKLRDVFAGMFPDRETRMEETHKFLRDNVSRYATQDMLEADAEIISMVLAPSYKAGTLPKPIEDHVYSLFKRKKA